jgi:cell division septation protein DedD
MRSRRAALTLVTHVAALAACGCTAPTIGQEKPVWPPARFIVKPRAPVANEAQIEALVRSKLDRPERVRLFRQMSGGAWVFEMVPLDAREEMNAVVDQLRASGAFEYVEVDAPVTIR